MNIKKHLLDNATLKVFSGILGYAFWTILSCSHTSTIWKDVPLCFYGEHQYALHAPEKISIALSGKRTDLRAINFDTLALHIDATTLHVGPNAVLLDNKSLFLPDSIKLIHYRPANIVVELSSTHHELTDTQENQKLT